MSSRIETQIPRTVRQW